ncbi:serine/threonine-protein kinase PINK1, mitochondrial [Asbolus verrucosus]|uniref:non-specific serine/threonine protein kinase n=1 Tax=Asbolus verrucosus TaxID=1661398 RepID=A0A482VUA5_ASBVE|nr:serine/threonine-protein kinase PINK1, mitochondrial [Asbolus verrucosus]
MSVRAVGIRLFKHGRSLVQQICKRDLNTTIGDKINAVSQATAAPPPLPKTQAVPRNFALRNVGVQLGLQARRILIDNVLNRVTNSLSAELRKKATRRILFGDSGPFFALVGVSLASGTGILTKEEELEGVCWEIREAVSKIKWHYHDIDESRFEDEPMSLKDLSLGKPIAKGANGVVYSAQVKEDDVGDTKHPFALKMMFNYDIQSNSMEILKAMYRETVPARLYFNNHDVNDWEVELSNRRKQLPPHPNIVAIFSVFTDHIEEFEDSKDLCPAALPKRLHPDGEGRNMSLFLLMKRYDCNLQNFLSTTPSIRTSLLLLSQLLEGVAHLTAHGIAHRDLKSDNLLLDTTEPDSPILVISDFGCCLADKNSGLLLPYTSYETDKGGNTALMAPEIINQKPGTFSVLNYTKADLWATGAIAYEIFGCPNPFYGSKRLKNVNYKEQELPPLPQEVPSVIQLLIGNFLKRNPNKRLHPEVAANVCQLFLWAPSAWLKQGIKMPSSAEILQWLLSLTTKVLCEGKINNKSFGRSDMNVGRRTYPEYLLISSFLCRAKLSNIRSALSWIQENTAEIDY